MIKNYSYKIVGKSKVSGALASTKLVKFHCPIGQDAKAAAIAHFNARYTVGNVAAYTIVSVAVKAAKPATKKITVNQQHDYITVSAVFPEGRVNFTVSFGGVRMSNGTDDRTLNLAAFHAFNRLTKTQAPVAAIAFVKALGDASSSLREFMTAVSKAVSPAKAIPASHPNKPTTSLEPPINR